MGFPGGLGAKGPAGSSGPKGRKGEPAERSNASIKGEKVNYNLLHFYFSLNSAAIES